MPGASILDHFEHLQLKFGQKYLTTQTFILGLPFLITPERTEKGGKGCKSQNCTFTHTNPIDGTSKPVKEMPTARETKITSFAHQNQWEAFTNEDEEWESDLFAQHIQYQIAVISVQSNRWTC